MTLKKTISALTDREVVAYWNIEQWAKRFGNEPGPGARLIAAETKKRGIPHEAGKLTEAVGQYSGDYGE